MKGIFCFHYITKCINTTEINWYVATFAQEANEKLKLSQYMKYIQARTQNAKHFNIYGN